MKTLLHGEVEKVPEGSSFRWLFVESAVKVIYEHYGALMMTLEDDKDKTRKAAGPWKFTAASLFLLITAFLQIFLLALVY